MSEDFKYPEFFSKIAKLVYPNDNGFHEAIESIDHNTVGAFFEQNRHLNKFGEALYQEWLNLKDVYCGYI